uniref:DUF4806 domain-containing protein n=2 Tax=Schistocephalus solidus TaxID=70667 RepID=A0A0X3PVG7_SCHSO
MYPGCQKSMTTGNLKSYHAGRNSFFRQNTKEMACEEAILRPSTDNSPLYKVKVLNKTTSLPQTLRFQRRAQKVADWLVTYQSNFNREKRKIRHRLITFDSDDDVSVSRPGTSVDRFTDCTSSSDQAVSSPTTTTRSVQCKLCCSEAPDEFLVSQLENQAETLRHVAATLCQLKTKVDTIMMQTRWQAPDGPQSDRLPLPLTNQESYDKFCHSLADDAVFDRTTKQLSLLRGRNVRELIRKILSGLLGPPLCRQFTLRGTVTKHGFINSPLYAIFLGK